MRFLTVDHIYRRWPRYIETQQEHHKKRSFVEEYKKMLEDFGFEYDERFVLKPVEV